MALSTSIVNGTTDSHDRGVPKYCKAGVVTTEGLDFEVAVEMVLVPEPGPDELLLKLNTAGICFSDVHFMLNDWMLPKMSAYGVRSAGHEGAGYVAKVGKNVKGWKVGDRAGIKPIWSVCQSCELCTHDSEAYCSKAVFTGLAHTGSWQEYVTTPADYTPRIPDGVDDFIAAPLMCSATTMYRSIVESNLKPGSWACFPGGAGGVGIQGVQLAKAVGLRPIVIDAGADKKDLSVKMGAEAFVDFRETKDVVAAVVMIADGIGAHGVFVTAPQAYATAVDLVGSRVGAIVMCVGLPPAKSLIVGAEPERFVFKHFTVKGTLVGTIKDTEKVLDFARQGLLKPICEVWPVDKFPDAVKRLQSGKVAGRVVINYNE